MPDFLLQSSAAVLLSGGFDSSVLAAELLDSFSEVHPIYVRFGLRWENAELAGLRTYLREVSRERSGLKDLIVLDEPIEQVYGNHWSNSGQSGVPGFSSSDDAVYLPGRNVLLTAKASVWCRLRDIETLALGTLKGNPFPDAGPDFFKGLESVLNQAMEGRLRIIRPYEQLSKLDVLKRGAGLPLHLTFSCLNPCSERHCGACNKCAERQKVFRDAGILDLTDYAMAPVSGEPNIVGTSSETKPQRN